MTVKYRARRRLVCRADSGELNGKYISPGRQTHRPGPTLFISVTLFAFAVDNNDICTRDGICRIKFEHSPGKITGRRLELLEIHQDSSFIR